MFSTQMFEGEHIRLAALEPELDAPVVSGWYADPEFVHQVTRGPGRPLSTPQIRAQLTREDTESREKRRRFDFAIRTREGDRLIGLVGLREILWNHGEGRLELAIGSAADRGHGLGAEALGLILRYAFTELNLYRVWLDIGGDNGDAIRFFERHGFVAEVRRRQALERAGQRFDILRLSLLLEEWRGEAVPAETDPAEATPGIAATPVARPTRPRVRLAAFDTEAAAEAERRWWSDSEFGHFQDYDIWRPRSRQHAQEEVRDMLTVEPTSFPFHLRLTADDRLIGFVGLWVDWPNREAWLGIGIGERDCWGQGYGTEAVQLATAFAFDDLNLHRVSLDALAANARGVRAYQKAGFVFEGRIRRRNNYGGVRVDDISMGLLRKEVG